MHACYMRHATLSAQLLCFPAFPCSRDRQALWTSSRERAVRQLLLLLPLIAAQLFPMGLIAGESRRILLL